MYSYSYYSGPNPAVTAVLFLIALAGGVCAYLLFVKNGEQPSHPFLVKLKEYLSFKTMIIEDLLKATYIIVAIFVTLYSLQIMFGTSFITGLVMLIFLNIFVRIAHEASLVLLLIWRNTNDIKNKLHEKPEVVEVVKEVKPEETKKEEVTEEVKAEVTVEKTKEPAKKPRKRTTTTKKTTKKTKTKKVDEPTSEDK